MGLSPRTLRPANNFTPRSITGLALWLDASDASSLYTTDAGAVTAVSAPTEIGSLAIWLDASDSATLFQDASATTAASAASDPIGCWKDKSGNDRHYTGSSTTRPLLALAKHNGRNSIYFDGTDDLLGVGGGSTTNSNSTLADATGACAWVVYEPNSDIDYAVLKFANSASGYERFTNGATYHTFFRTSRFAALSPAPPTSGLTLLASSASVATDSQALRINGSTIVSQPCATTFAAWRALTSQAWTVGQDAAFLNGWVSEVIVLGRSATATEVAQVEKYLAAKWGISGVHSPATATGDPVGAWLDKSGNARHATQSVSASRPTISATAQNGKKQLSLASTQGNCLSTSSLTLSAPYSLIAVVSSPSRRIGTFAGSGTNSNTQFGDGSATYSGAYYGASRIASVVYGSAPIAIGRAQVFSAVASSGTLPSALSMWADGVGGVAGTVFAGSPAPDNALGGPLQIGATGTSSWGGTVCEMIAYSKSLTVAERQRIERYLAAKWGITLAPTVSTADAQDWINRVYANGGTVSSSTAAAVSTFCDAIDSAGLRSKFYRLSLMCGDNLLAALVPLYRSTSFGGTVLGLATDDNVGFVSGDYTLAGSLNNAAGTKYLRLNARPFSTLLPAGNDRQSGHVAVSFTGANTSPSLTSPLIGIQTSTSGEAYHVNARYSGSQFIFWGTRAFSWTPTATSGRVNLISTRNSGRNSIYEAGVEGAGSTGASTTPDSDARFAVYASGSVSGADSVANSFTGRIYAYSVGAGLSPEEAAAYNTHLTTFLNAIGRTA